MGPAYLMATLRGNSGIYPIGEVAVYLKSFLESYNNKGYYITIKLYNNNFPDPVLAFFL